MKPFLTYNFNTNSLSCIKEILFLTKYFISKLLSMLTRKVFRKSKIFFHFPILNTIYFSKIENIDTLFQIQYNNEILKK